MTPQTLTIRDFYTRKVGGERYDYELTYSPGTRVVWSARVYRDGMLKGSPGGIEIDNHLQGEALRRNMVALVEVVIEGMQGLQE